ncbi:hypothetical protein [Kribbella sp. C-35]|uniref:hypothetical protein n=1 Tax=Kribbella sp. C-35 TaxID=2789276 RepID=UPI003979AD26
MIADPHAGRTSEIRRSRRENGTSACAAAPRQGDFLHVPPNTAHAFEAADTEPAEVLFVLTNTRPRFGYYRLLEAAYRGETNWSEVAITSDLYDNYYVESPTWQNR